MNRVSDIALRALIEGYIPPVLDKEKTLKRVASELRSARKVIELYQDNVHGNYCYTCEGNGLMWVDAKAHLPSYKGATTACSQCEGTGEFRDFSVVDEALEAHQAQFPEERS